MFANIKYFVLTKVIFLSSLFTCAKPDGTQSPERSQALVTDSIHTLDIRTGAEQIEKYLSLLQGKRVAAMVNQTSVVGNTHLVDTLLSLEIRLQKIFAPEHGFRGEADAGEKIVDGVDIRTGLPVISLYGNKKKPTPADLADVDLVIFDIQDVGVRFYTFISAMSYLMEACAENQKQLLVLDRPNPNGHYTDGPVLEAAFQSYVGLHPVPVVHGMTVGEYAKMVNGEGWLPDAAQCELTIIPCANYDHSRLYELPIKPSPNLPNLRSIYLYPSLCFFEGTDVSIGRGTDFPFQAIGAPGFPRGEFTFTPEPRPGAGSPKHNGKLCRGYDLRGLDMDAIRNRRSLDLSYLIEFYHHYPDQQAFFLETKFIDKLAGSDQLRKDIMAGKSDLEIRKDWQPSLDSYRIMRRKYLLYDDYQ